MSKRSTKNESAQTKGEVVANCDQFGLTQSVTRIEDYIHVIRGKQVMLDRDLAALYGVETKILNKSVKRNIERFPEDFMFQLTEEEFLNLRFQIGTSSYGCKSNSYIESEKFLNKNGTSNWGGSRYLPYVFTENGVAMLSGILRSPKAIETNIAIMRAFTAMRRFMMDNVPMFTRLEAIEHHQLLISDKVETLETQMSEVFNRFDGNEKHPKQGIFFDQQIYDAYDFVSGLIKRAKKRIILIDNYVDESVLTMLDKREAKVTATLYTAKIDKQLQLDIAKHNAQYPAIDVKIFTKSHDRFLCIDSTVYHVGASIKDLGKKWFAFSILHDSTPEDLVKRIMGT